MSHIIHNNKTNSGVRRAGLVAVAVALGVVVFAACGSETTEVASLPPVPAHREVSPLLVDPGPSHQPDHDVLSNVLEGRSTDAAPSLHVEFGGMPAPVGEPNWRAQRASVPPIEFGGMPAPVGEPNWRTQRASVPPIEFGGMPAPVGEPNWATRPVTVPVELGGLPAPYGEPNWAALPTPVPPVEFGGLPAPLGEGRMHRFDGAIEPGPIGGPR